MAIKTANNVVKVLPNIYKFKFHIFGQEKDHNINLCHIDRYLPNEHLSQKKIISRRAKKRLLPFILDFLHVFIYPLSSSLRKKSKLKVTLNPITFYNQDIFTYRAYD